MEIRDVDDWVDQAATLPIESFYPSAVSQYTGIPITEVFERLVYLAEDKQLKLRFEIRCPSYECARTADTVDVIPDFNAGDQLAKCTVCGEFELTPNLIFPVFEFDPSYRARMKSKKKLPTHVMRLRPVALY